MKALFAPCSECTKEGDSTKKFIVNRTHMLCPDHNRARLDKQGQTKKPRKQINHKRFNTNFKYANLWGYTSEITMFKDIWNERPHVSQASGRPIPYFSISNFAHILAKGLNKYPHFRYYPGNIMLLHPEEHIIYDQGTSDDAERYKKRFPSFDISTIKKAAERLKIDYRNMFEE